MNNKIDEKEFLKTYNQKKYECPSVATDMVVFSIKESAPDSYRSLGKKRLSVLLIKRGGHPYINCWALPGGFVNRNETVEQAAYRELNEETGVEQVILRQLQVFSDPNRDKRGWVMSSAFMALTKSENLRVESNDDAMDAKWFDVKLQEIFDIGQIKVEEEAEKVKEEYNQKKIRLYHLTLSYEKMLIKAFLCVKNTGFEVGADDISILCSDGIAFDHAAIMLLAVLRLRNGIMYSGIAFSLTSDEFTLTELQKVYETILNEKLTAANFRRKIEPYVEETGKMSTGAGYRPAMLYRQRK